MHPFLQPATKPILLLLVLLLAVPLLGCRTPQAVTQLERENYALENKIWQLVDRLEQSQAELEACRRQLEEVRRQGGVRFEKSGQNPPRELDAPVWPDGNAIMLPASPEVGAARPIAPPEIHVEPPKREVSSERALPGGSSPQDQVQVEENPIQPPVLMAPPTESLQSTPNILPGETRRQASPLENEQSQAEATPWSRSSPSPPIANNANETPVDSAPVDIRLVKKWVVGRDYDGQVGDDGIAVLVQPIDGQGQTVLQPAKLAVVVIDPALQGSAARVARWDLAPEEVQSYQVRQPGAEGFLLELPWPGPAPEHEDLKVFVRYETADGRRLETNADLRIHLPSSG